MTTKQGFAQTQDIEQERPDDELDESALDGVSAGMNVSHGITSSIKLTGAMSSGGSGPGTSSSQTSGASTAPQQTQPPIKH